MAAWTRRFIGGAWGDWTWLGGRITGNPTSAATSINSVSVFARGMNGHLFQNTWGASGWTDWQDRGGNIAGTPTAVSRATDTLDVFYREAGTDQLMVIRKMPGGDWLAPLALGGAFK